jgi:hypothetical protein
MPVTKLRAVGCVLLALVASCTKYWDPAQAEANIVSAGNFKAGSGEVTQVGVLPGKGCRLYLRMDVTGTQSVDIDKCNFMQGEFVDLTNDGRVVRLSGTSLNEALGNAKP